MFVLQGICELKELRMLYLHSNRIENLKEVDKLGELQHLHTITLHGNPIESTRDYRWQADGLEVCLFCIETCLPSHLAWTLQNKFKSEKSWWRTQLKNAIPKSAHELWLNSWILTRPKYVLYVKFRHYWHKDAAKFTIYLCRLIQIHFSQNPT